MELFFHPLYVFMAWYLIKHKGNFSAECCSSILISTGSSSGNSISRDSSNNRCSISFCCLC
jgi:hypothetical protein